MLVADLKSNCALESSSDISIGFVPTMGALHSGHIELVKKARRENKYVFASVFVNPTQFSAGEDFDKYPRMVDTDVRMLEDAGVDCVFVPSVADMYPKQKLCHVEPQAFSQIYEGQARPEFFRGVATVVTKLFGIVRPTVSYFGQKDISQCILIRQMVKDLNLPVDIHVCETVRASDGLALSSRNAYLSEKERIAAPILYQALLAGKQACYSSSGSAVPVNRSEVLSAIKNTLMKEPLVAQVEYISIASHDDMKELDAILPQTTGAVLSAAIRLCDSSTKSKDGSPRPLVRLIDNVLVGTSEDNILGLSHSH